VAGDRKPFLLRLDPALLRAVQRWAQDDLRSLNAQIEFLLRSALVRAGRMRDPTGLDAGTGGEPPGAAPGPRGSGGA